MPRPRQKIGKFEKIRVHQGFPAGEHNPADLKPLDCIHLRFKLSQSELAMFAGLPDVTHDAPAIAAAMSVDQ